MDDYSQPDAPLEFFGSDSKSATRRGSKGNRKAQSARYYERNRSKRRDYMRRYMAARAKAAVCTLLSFMVISGCSEREEQPVGTTRHFEEGEMSFVIGGQTSAVFYAWCAASSIDQCKVEGWNSTCVVHQESK